MKIDKKNLTISIFVALILAYIMPYEIIEKETLIYGFPFRFLTIYIDLLAKDGSMLFSASLQLLPLALNVSVIYACTSVMKRIRDKKRMD